MKRLPHVIRYLLLTVICVVPFVLNAVHYASGAVDELFWFFPFLTAFSWLNHRFTDKPGVFLLFQLLFLLCAVYSCWVNAWQYYCNIGHDFETLTVGELFAYLEGGSVLLITTIVFLFKMRKKSPS